MSDLSKCEKRKACIGTVMSELNTVIDECLKDVKLPPKEWRVFYRVFYGLSFYPNKQTQHLSDYENGEIKNLRLTHEYSIEDLAWIFHRSKSTIFESLKRQGVETE